MAATHGAIESHLHRSVPTPKWLSLRNYISFFPFTIYCSRIANGALITFEIMTFGSRISSNRWNFWRTLVDLWLWSGTISGYLYDCVWCAACDGRCPAEIAQTTNNSFVFNFEQMLERGARVNVSEASHCFVLSPAFWPIFMTANKFVVILARVSLQM